MSGTSKQEIIFSLLNVARGGRQSNEEQISESQISWEIDNTRAKLIRQDQNKNRSINPDLIQTLCIDLDLADASDCPCEIVGCTILKSILPIPPAIELNARNLVISVGPIDLSRPRFNLIPYDRAIYYNPNKFSNSITGCFIHNSFLFVIAKTEKINMLEVCTMNIILERPEDAQNFTCSGTPCYTVDSKYPVSAAMIPDIQNIILSTILKIESTALREKTGDGSADLKSPIETNP